MLSGILMLFKLLHPRNAIDRILSMLLGSETEVKLLQNINASGGMLFILLGTTIDCNPSQPLNAFSAINRVPSAIE